MRNHNASLLIFASFFINFLLLSSILIAMQPPGKPHLLTIKLLKPLGIVHYERGKYWFAQVWVPSQFKTNDGYSKNKGSCGYHALRNGILLGNAALNSSCADQHIADIISKKKLWELCKPDGPWRSFIKKSRKNQREKEIKKKGEKAPKEKKYTGTNFLDTQEVDELINHEIVNKALTTAKGIHLATYENTTNLPLNNPDFEGLCIGESLRAIKNKLDNNQDVTGAVLIHIHAVQGKSNKELTLEELFEKFTSTGGHWITLVINAVEGKRQYIIADSAACSLLRHPTVQKLINYLEGTTNQDITSALQHIANKSTILSVVPSTKTNLTSDAYATVTPSHCNNLQLLEHYNPQTSSTYDKMSFLKGTLLGAVFFMAYKGYCNYKAKKKAKTARNLTLYPSIR